MTEPKPSFREGENNISTLLYLFVFLFIGFLFGCEKKKVDNKAVDNQTNRNTMQYFLDSAMFVLNKNKSLQDTIYNHNITQVNIVSQNYDTFAFISINGDAIENDSIIFPNPLYIAYFNLDKWVLKDSIVLDEMAKLFPDTIRKEDINFDNHKDFIIVYTIKSASREVKCYESLLLNSQKIINKLRFYSTDTVAILPKTKNIITWGDGGNFGTHKKRVYQWNSDTLQEIRKLERTIVTNKYRGIFRYTYTMVEYVLQHNKLVKKREWLDKDGIDYFEKWQ